MDDPDARTSELHPNARHKTTMRCAIYARVSTLDQHVENQLTELRSYVERRGWTAVEYVDQGVSGAKDRRPALDELLKAARRRRFDVLVCWRLDRLGRNLRHLILLLDELQALGIAFVTLGRGHRHRDACGAATAPRSVRDCGVRAQPNTGAGRRGPRSGAGSREALGTTPLHPRAPGAELNVRDAARVWGVSKSTAARWLAAGKSMDERTTAATNETVSKVSRERARTVASCGTRP